MATVDPQFEEFVRGRSSALLRTALLLVGDRQHAEDLLQEAVWRTHRHWSAASGNPDAYARRVLVNLAHDRHRRSSRRVREAPFDARTSHLSVDEPADLLEREVLVAALRQLGARQRAALVLRFWEDLSIQETADALGCTPGTVKSTTSKGLERLCALLDAVPDDGGRP